MKKKKKIHGRSSLHTKLIRFEVSVCYIQRSICDGRKKKQGEAYFSINSSSYPIHMYYFSYVSVWIDGIHLCPNDETTLIRVEGIIIYLFLFSLFLFTLFIMIMSNTNIRMRDSDEHGETNHDDLLLSCSFQAILRLIVFCLLYIPRSYSSN